MPVAIVTGGSRGFGRALAADLVSAGWDVVIDGRDSLTLKAAADDLGSRVHAVAGDVTDVRHRADLVEEARRLGGLDLLVNNAGALGPTPLPPLRDLETDALVQLHATNVVAPLALVQKALSMLESSRGAVVNVTSDAAVEAYGGWGAYGSTKAAIELLSHVLAVEEPDVRVWWLDPGDMRTSMHQAAFPGEDISDRQVPETVAPAVRLLVELRPESGRIRAVELLKEAER